MTDPGCISGTSGLEGAGGTTIDPEGGRLAVRVFKLNLPDVAIGQDRFYAQRSIAKN